MIATLLATPLAVLAAVAVFLVLAVWLGLLPPVKIGTRDRNHRFYVTIRPASDPKYKVEPRAAVLAQELAEWLFKWLVALAIAAPAVWWFAQGELAPFGALAVVIAHLWPMLPGGERQLELVGHMVEIEAARRLGRSEAYAVAEAKRMVDAYPPFMGADWQELLEAMYRRRWIALILLAIVWRRAKPNGRTV